jgi:colicin import membrane protein
MSGGAQQGSPEKENHALEMRAEKAEAAVLVANAQADAKVKVAQAEAKVAQAEAKVAAAEAKAEADVKVAKAEAKVAEMEWRLGLESAAHKARAKSSRHGASVSSRGDDGRTRARAWESWAGAPVQVWR